MKRKTKIIATLGPSTSDYKTLYELAKNGLNLARINFSHGNYKEYKEKLNILKKIYKENNLLVSVMFDLKGPKIRCHKFKDGEAMFYKGDLCKIVMKEVLGTKEIFSVNYDDLYDDLRIDDVFAFDDGFLKFKVVDKLKNKTLLCEALNDHLLKDNKGLNASRIKLSNKYISKQDLEDIEFVCSTNASYLAASYIRNKDDILEIKNILRNHSREDIKIVAKIESPEAVDNIDEIILVSDAVMIARGDLGVEVEIEEVPIIQKEIIKRCNMAGKPVIVATHMLESMQNSPLPTRAEVSDVFNAVLDGADAIMLSGETATGKYPLESFLMQAKIAQKAEEIVDYAALANEFYESSNKSQGDAIGISVSKSVLMLNASFVVIISDSFITASKLAKFKIKVPIIAVVKDIASAQILNGLYYGLYPLINDKAISLSYEDKELIAYKIVKEFGAKKGETIILVTDNSKNNKSNSMKILQVE